MASDKLMFVDRRAGEGTRMNDLNLNLFYKTTFEVRAKKPDGDVLWQIVCEVRNWICDKWDQRGVSITRNGAEWTRFKNGKRSNLSTADGTVRIDSASCWTGRDSGQWACSITEIDRQPMLAPREWKTEIGFLKLAKNKGVLSLVLTYGDRPGYLGPVQPQPSNTIPGIVWKLFKNFKIACLTSGRVAPRGPIELKAGSFGAFWKFVSNQRRETPIVFISPRMSGADAELLLNPQDVYNALGPSG